ncbi:flagellar biosynthetic protein FliO [Moorella sp. Hama-1]|uniref:flagellar biosynthetic protein FliO n=1 Tax=Moorella sp. Hama-1 TaxID=2138101 RepID=UPI000D655C03|nr:flagellar biosynthetic protein FliO [Moorella sp. Hama-1]BCV20822.1 flagellar protein [Moorella sp. Hama-1]
MDHDLLWALVRVAIFLPLVALLAYLTVRLGFGQATGLAAGSGELRLIERLQLSNKSGLAVVRCGERYFLVGLGEGPPALLAELPDYPATAAAGDVKVFPVQTLDTRGGEDVLAEEKEPVLRLLKGGWQRLKGHDK